MRIEEFEDPGPDVGHPMSIVVTNLIKEIIWAHDNKKGRSIQKNIGPSELGERCDLRLAYGERHTDKVNHSTDGWQAIVGTAIHSWMQEAVEDYDGSVGRFLTEKHIEVETPAGFVIGGSVDLYDRRLKMVVDYKSVDPSAIPRIMKYGTSGKYVAQRNVYALGMENIGEGPVEWCANVFLPRGGKLEQAFSTVAAFDRRQALATLKHYDTIRARHDEPLSNFTPTPSNLCGWCSWHLPNSVDINVGCRGKDQQ